jgi:hypothetical protein
MNWHYVENGQQVGPVTDEQLAQLAQQGSVRDNTLVWRDGLANWVPYSEVKGGIIAPPPALNLAAPVSAQRGGIACAECGRIFPADELISLNRSWVCAQCKPVFLQRMAEGVPTAGAAGIWRQGKKLVTRSETPFPDRCIKCNGPANGFRLKRVLYWNHPAYYLLLLCNLLVLLIVVLIVRKKAVLHIGLCQNHREQRRMAIIACSIGMLGGVGLIVCGAVYNSGWLALAGVVLFFTGAIWGIVKGRTISAVKIDKELVTVSGVGRNFLEQLPERPF